MLYINISRSNLSSVAFESKHWKAIENDSDSQWCKKSVCVCVGGGGGIRKCAIETTLLWDLIFIQFIFCTKPAYAIYRYFKE